MAVRLTFTAFLLLSLLPVSLGASLWEAYHSEDQHARRVGMANTRFRPLLHLKGQDDWRTLGAQEHLFETADIDENGVFMQAANWNTSPGRVLTGGIRG